MSKVPAGGPATINGVLYQMLWSLLQTTEIKISEVSHDNKSKQLTHATIMLEPAGGGGDLRIQTHDGTIVEQVKAKSGGGTWSLTDIVKSVMPDLIKAVDLEDTNRRYRFVTEGRMGGWTATYESFAFFRDHACPEHGILDALDDKSELKFHRVRKSKAGKQLFWPDERYSSRSLFRRMAEHLMDNSRHGQYSSISSVYRRLWHLLGRFEFVGEKSPLAIQSCIDKYLLGYVEHEEDIPDLRDAMLAHLARQATAGDSSVTRQSLFEEYLLTSTDLNNWQGLLCNNRDWLRTFLSNRRYDSTSDVRFDRYAQIAEECSPAKPILVITGESGQGKSWFQYGLASYFLSHNQLSVLVDATGSADNTIEKGANIFWQDIKGNDRHVPLGRIAARRREVVHAHVDYWLTLFIDGLYDESEARQLAFMHWEDWGVRLVVACDRSLAKIIEAESSNRVSAYNLDDFSLEELHTYLARRFGDDWPDIPHDVRDTLRRPLLASIYREVAEGSSWHPKNEYELYDRCYQRLLEGTGAQNPLDAACLCKCAMASLRGAPYPWTLEQLKAADLDNESLRRLSRMGWLQVGQPGRYGIWHDRLLSWLVAEGLLSEWVDRKLDPDEFCRTIESIISGKMMFNGRHLGYVPMDIVWLLANRHPDESELLHQLIKTLEIDPWGTGEAFFAELLPAIGSSIVPYLFERLVAHSNDEIQTFCNSIIDGLESMNSEYIGEKAIELLEHESPNVQRSAMRLLARKPTPAALDRLWSLHCRRSTRFHRIESDSNELPTNYSESMSAMKACSKMNPNWLDRAIGTADPDKEPMESLAWMVAGLRDDGALWRRCKQSLIANVPDKQQRCIAANIHAHRDVDELDWLVSSASREDGLVGAAALGALAHIAPDAAIEEVGRLSERTLRFARNWWLPELLAKRPTETRSRLLELMRAQEHAFPFALVYHGREEAMDAPTLDVLLDCLADLLERDLTDQCASTSDPLYVPLLMLAKIHKLTLLDRFSLHRGQRLERNLTQWLLRRGPRKFCAPDCLEREPAARVLYMIGGSGFTDVVNDWLQGDSKYGRLDGLKIAAKRANEDTISLLARISQQDELWDKYPIEQSYATTALAALDRWDHVVKALVRWGLQLDRKATEQRPAYGPLDDDDLCPALDVIDARDIPPGAIRALGIGKRRDHIQKVHEIASGCDPASDIALACVLALTDLGEHSPRAEEFFREQLEHPSHRCAAALGLLNIGTDSAIGFLKTQNEKAYNFVIAANLALRKETRQSAAYAIWSEIQKSTYDGSASAIIDCLGALPDSAVRNYLRKIAFSPDHADLLVGYRGSAIRGLSHFDPEDAFLAAQNALRDQTSRDSLEYPRILMELDGDRATPLLLAEASKGRSPAMLAEIGRCLREKDIVGHLVTSLTSPNAEERLAACRLFAWCTADKSAEAKIRDRLEDSDQRVVRSAIGALRRFQRSSEADEIQIAIKTEQDTTRRWILLDALLEIADPGSTGQSYPTWAQEVAEVLPSHMRHYLYSGLSKQRKKDQEELAKAKW